MKMGSILYLSKVMEEPIQAFCDLQKMREKLTDIISRADGKMLGTNMTANGGIILSILSPTGCPCLSHRKENAYEPITFALDCAGIGFGWFYDLRCADSKRKGLKIWIT